MTFTDSYLNFGFKKEMCDWIIVYGTGLTHNIQTKSNRKIVAIKDRKKERCVCV